MSVEHTSTQVSATRMVSMQNRANEFLRRRFQRRDRSGTRDSRNNINYDGFSTNPVHSRANANGLMPSMKLSSGRAATSVPALQEANECVDMLRGDIDRVKAGITLLSQSIDKLSDLLQNESTCCSCVYNFFPFFSSESPPAITRRRSGYDRIENFDFHHEEPASNMLLSASKQALKRSRISRSQ